MAENQTPQACSGVGSQLATICLPVSVTPYAITGPASFHCCGDMIITPACNECCGKENGSCDFTITQTIKIDIPVEFGASVKIGDTFIECGCTSVEEYDNAYCTQDE
ncbi:hypothetical protein ACTQ6A_13550 [Lachnospiraceae bacterium LCP25S3_G4]